MGTTPAFKGADNLLAQPFLPFISRKGEKVNSHLLVEEWTARLSLIADFPVFFLPFISGQLGNEELAQPTGT